MAEPTYQCWAKATNRESGVPRRSSAWVAAKRAWFRVFADRLECGRWTIPVASIRKAILYEGRSLLMPVRVLEVQTDGGSYQFGFNPWVTVDQHLPFSVERVKTRFGYSRFSLAIRLVLFGYLAYVVWTSL